MREPYIVLGEYVPEKYEAKDIGLHLIRLTSKLRVVPYKSAWPGATWTYSKYGAEVRNPLRQYDSSAETECRWHRDSETVNKVAALVLWSSTVPTEITFDDPTKESPVVLSPNPFEIILLNNRTAYHRRPKAVYECNNRWFFRQFLQEIPEQYKEVLA